MSEGNLPNCPLCGNDSFERAVCERCRYVLTFYDHNSIFDFN